MKKVKCFYVLMRESEVEETINNWFASMRGKIYTVDSINQAIDKNMVWISIFYNGKTLIMADVNDIVKKMSKNLQDYAFSLDNPQLEREVLSTGVDAFDKILGGGYRRGLLHLFTGETNTGKTLMTYFAIVEAQKKNWTSFYIDLENCFDPVWARKIGIKDENFTLIKSAEHKPLTGETVFDIITALIESEADLIVVDSLAAILPMAEYEGTGEDQFMALQARLLGRMYRKIAATNTKTVFLAVNQLRQKLGGTMHQGIESVAPGGKAPLFYSSLVTKVSKRGSIVKKEVNGETVYEHEDSGGMKKKEGVKAGFDIELFTEKCKFFPEHQSCIVPFNFYEGTLEKTASLVELGLQEGIIKQSGAWYFYKDKKLQGKQSVTDYFDNNPNELEELRAKILE